MHNNNSLVLREQLSIETSLVDPSSLTEVYLKAINYICVFIAGMHYNTAYAILASVCFGAPME